MRSGDKGKSTIAGVPGALSGGGSMTVVSNDLAIGIARVWGICDGIRDDSARLSFTEPVRMVVQTPTQRRTATISENGNAIKLHHDFFTWFC